MKWRTNSPLKVKNKSLLANNVGGKQKASDLHFQK